jgi:carbonic anhydrase
MCGKQGKKIVPQALVSGFHRFRELYYEKDPALFRDELMHGQNPKVAVVACSDSRVDPAIILQTEPGDIFTVRNVAALVPPCEHDGHYHGTSAALEYAVTVLKVEHVIIIGHSHCGGVAAMVRKQEEGACSGGFVATWTDLLREARDRALSQEPTLAGEDLVRASERQAVQLSLDNLRTFPFVHEAETEGRLTLHGWYLDIVSGELLAWDDGSGQFVPL